MTNESIKSFAIIVMVCALFVNVVSYSFLYDSYTSLRAEAIKRGYLEWVPNQVGNPVLKWKED